jgi:hypothetical protein
MGMFSGPGNFGVVRCKMPAKCAVKCQLPRLYCSSLLGSGGIGSQGCRREKDRFVGGPGSSAPAILDVVRRHRGDIQQVA